MKTIYENLEKLDNRDEVYSYQVFEISTYLNNSIARSIGTILSEILPRCRALTQYALECTIGGYPNQQEMALMYLIDKYKLEIYSRDGCIDVYSPVQLLVPESKSIDGLTTYPARISDSKKIIIKLVNLEAESTLGNNWLLYSDPSKTKIYVSNEEYISPSIAG